MTPTRAKEFAETWNGGDAARVASHFAQDGVYHASVGPEPLGASFVWRAEIERGVATFFASTATSEAQERLPQAGGSGRRSSSCLVVRPKAVSNREAVP